MFAETSAIEKILQEIQILSEQDRIRLIGRIVETMLDAPSTDAGRLLIYGEFSGSRLSCEEDFLEAEWRSSDEDSNGR